MNPKKATAAAFATAIVALLVALLGIWFPEAQSLPDPVVGLGTTNFTDIEAEDLTLSDDLTVADDTTLTDDVTISGDATVAGTLKAQGNVSDSGGTFTVADDVMIDGAADAVQLTVQGYTTQTNSILVVENSSAVDLFTVAGTGDVLISGTTPLLTIGDAGTEDTTILFDGAAQDFHIGLDDTADDLVVGLGSALGTTTAFAVDENLVTTWSGGTLELAATTTATDTLTASECGKTIFLSSATEYQTTLPAISTVAAGCAFRFIIAAAPASADYTIITGNSLENVLYGGINELEVDTNDDGPFQAAGDTITFADGVAVVGDWVYMISDGSYFYLTGQAQADGGITPSQAD